MYDLHIRLRQDELAALAGLPGSGSLSARARRELLRLIGWSDEQLADVDRARVEAHREAMGRARARRRPGTAADYDRDVIVHVPETIDYP